MNATEHIILRRKVAAWSDANLYSARRFITERTELFHKGLTTTQLHGILNVVRTGKKPDKAFLFISHQRTKYDRKRNFSMKDFLSDLAQILGRVQTDARTIGTQINPRSPEMISDIAFKMMAQRLILFMIAEKMVLERSIQRDKQDAD